jgi:hypothetical protein
MNWEQNGRTFNSALSDLYLLTISSIGFPPFLHALTLNTGVLSAAAVKAEIVKMPYLCPLHRLSDSRTV